MTPEQRIVAWSRTVLRQPFEWGKTDCAMLTLQALELLTGKKYLDAYRGAWTSEEEALAHFQHEKPSDVLKGWGAQQVPPAFAVFGDVVTAPAAPWPEQLHFVLGRHAFTSDQARGVALVPTRLLTALTGAQVWRVAPCLKPYH